MQVLVNRLGGLSLPRKSVARLTDHPDMTLDVYRGRKTTNQLQQQHNLAYRSFIKLQSLDKWMMTEIDIFCSICQKRRDCHSPPEGPEEEIG